MRWVSTPTFLHGHRTSLLHRTVRDRRHVPSRPPRHGRRESSVHCRTILVTVVEGRWLSSSGSGVTVPPQCLPADRGDAARQRPPRFTPSPVDGLQGDSAPTSPQPRGCDTVLTSRPTTHACLQGGAVEETASPARYRCDRCSASFPSSRGLVNHRLWHRDRDARVATRRKTTTTRRPPRLTSAPTSSPDASSDHRERVDANTTPAATASNDLSTPPNEVVESPPDTPPVASPPASPSPTAPRLEPVHHGPAASRHARADGPPPAEAFSSPAQGLRLFNVVLVLFGLGRRAGPSPATTASATIQEAASINRGRVFGTVTSSAATAGRASLIAANVQPVFFPVPQPLRSTEGGCPHEYGSASWTGRVHSLMRHLERDHRARIEERLFTCSRCGEDLPPRPSGHPCFEGGLPDHVTSQERHQCPRCPMSYTTAGALRNHTRRHQLEDARAGRSTAEPPAGPTSKVRRIGTPPGVGTSPGVNAIDAPPPSPPESAAPPTSPHAPLSPTGSDGPPTGRPSGGVDDDATGLLEAQARVLRSLLREPPSQDSWDRCEAAWTEALALVTTAVRLPQLTAGAEDATPGVRFIPPQKICFIVHVTSALAATTTSRHRQRLSSITQKH
ncbi:hypothetical protein HPB50_022787 [Hyalomma asiaticum]|uniref:Uncharacterized protein n=1 Tax=Hyalomma asiaticum TaxID=266040 RepID=A0ACB7TBM8_HYAAI|nr:hypothetical protein HPB50_022787 [Hyalomma asiaticum]